ncbi:hypothetical protein LJR034_000083 [Caballeronia sp. LjRoot34]|uniref:hypothetical protein n=1 Tax=Caballeronia sp. LjRoot34 TaxID=3342325 RepID=UPI003ECD23A0
MKKEIAALIVGAVVVVSTTANAGVLGILKNAEFVTTVTGKSAYRCVYEVLGQQAVVTTESYCPATMEFD